MSKRRRTVVKRKEQPESIVHVDPLDRTTLDEVQKTHLRFCENLGQSMPLFAGVRIGLAFTYELMQVLNNNYLQDHSQ